MLLKEEAEKVFTPLKQDELSYLIEKFRMQPEATGHPLSIEALKLHQPHHLKTFLERLKEYLCAPNLTTTASIFSKRYSYLIAVPTLYSMSVFRKKLDASLENAIIEQSVTESGWLPGLRLRKNLLSVFTDNEIDERRKATIQMLFKENLNVIWSKVAEQVNITKNLLWENTAVYVYWLFESTLQGPYPEDTKDRVRKDFDYLIYKATGEMFGETENPLRTYFHSKKNVQWSESKVRVRKTCCLAHTMPESAGYCITCPCKSSVESDFQKC
jgi:siderophore-iron reductase FhuF